MYLQTKSRHRSILLDITLRHPAMCSLYPMYISTVSAQYIQPQLVNYGDVCGELLCVLKPQSVCIAIHGRCSYRSSQGLFHPHLTKPSVTFYTTVHISGRHMYLYKINTSIRHIHQLQDSNSCKNFSTYSYIFFGSVWGGTTMC